MNDGTLYRTRAEADAVALTLTESEQRATSEEPSPDEPWTFTVVPYGPVHRIEVRERDGHFIAFWNL